MVHFADDEERVHSSFHARTNISKEKPEIEPDITVEEYRRLVHILESQVEQLKQAIHKYDLAIEKKVQSEIDKLLRNIPRNFEDEN